MSIAELATVGGTGFAIVLALIGAAYAFGKLSQRVAQVEGDISKLRGDIGDLRTKMQAGFADQTDRILAAMSNHRHLDTDGTTIFTIPQP